MSSVHSVTDARRKLCTLLSLRVLLCSVHPTHKHTHPQSRPCTTMRASSTAATLVACALALAALSGVALGKPIVGADGKTYLYEHARVPADEATPLDEYVAAEDTVFAWRETNYTLKGWGWTGHLLNLTSCAWLPEEEVGSASVWTHQLFVVVPDTIKDASTGTVWITGGDNGNPGNPKGGFVTGRCLWHASVACRLEGRAQQPLAYVPV